MFATATLAAHRGTTLVSREDLASYEPPEGTSTWRPVKHALIVDLMHEELNRREIQIAKEEYAIQREGHYLLAALTTNWLDTGDTAAAIAFRHSNDKTEAMKMYAGIQVFICDNAQAHLLPEAGAERSKAEAVGSQVQRPCYVLRGFGGTPHGLLGSGGTRLRAVPRRDALVLRILGR